MPSEEERAERRALHDKLDAIAARLNSQSAASDIDVLRENWLDIVASPAKTSPDFFRLTGLPGLIQLLLLLNLQ
jgi:hypothetical protein